MVWNFKPQMRAYRFVGHKVSLPVVAFFARLSTINFDPLTATMQGYLLMHNP